MSEPLSLGAESPFPWPHRFLSRTGALLALAGALITAGAVLASAAQTERVVLGGEIGAAANAAAHRLQTSPFDSLPWLRADLTGETVSEFDGDMKHLWGRPFKNYSGDISGRFIEVMSIGARSDTTIHPALKSLLQEVVKNQRPGGYVCASGVIDWQQPIDFGNTPKTRMMPALWGNARLLCGLVEASRTFRDPEVLAATRRLGDFYVSILPRFTDPARMSEYKGGDTYAAGYPICYFPAMEGLVKLYILTADAKYLQTAEKMAEFMKPFDRLPIDHAHGMLCNQVSLLLLHEVTGKPEYLQRVESRWQELVSGGYINPAGGVLEKCRPAFDRDEGCALADWLRLNLELGQFTGKPHYYAMAERTVHNHYLQNQAPSGGFGHRTIACDKAGVLGFENKFVEAQWCCNFHGLLGFKELSRQLVVRRGPALRLPLALDFACTNEFGVVTSRIEPGARKGEVLRQHVQLQQQPATVLQTRVPTWATGVTAVDAQGKRIKLKPDGAYVATAKPVDTATFTFSGQAYAENRRCEPLRKRPAAGEAFVVGYGPKILAVIDRQGPAATWPVTLETLNALDWKPLSRDQRENSLRFVAAPLPSGKQESK